MDRTDAQWLEVAEAMADRYATQLPRPGSAISQALKESPVSKDAKFRTITISIPSDFPLQGLHTVVREHCLGLGMEVASPSPCGWFIRPQGYRPGAAVELEPQRPASLPPLSAADEDDSTDAGVREVAA